MKIRNIFILIIIFFITQNIISQDFNFEQINLNRLSFLGIDSRNDLIFYLPNISQNKTKFILALDMSVNNFRLISQGDEINGRPVYFNKDLIINKFTFDKKIFIKYLQKDTILDYRPSAGAGDFSIAQLPNSDTIFISSFSTTLFYVFNKKTFEFTTIPLTGSNLQVRGDYLFFEAPRYSDNYSSFPDDIYRVHRSDLKNPEKILIQVEEEWHPYSEDVVYARTFPKIGECENKKCHGAFYNLATNNFSIVSNYVPAHKFIEIDSKSKILDIVEENGREVFQLKDIPKPPQTFPYKIEDDYTQKPRGNIFKYYNIPLKEKTLPDTFITHELLYIATEDELEKLAKAQLRILRNTFFAFQGYKFESDDLTEFFNQFDWYQKMRMGDKSNEDVVIWPDEKIRVELIRAIEESK